MGNRKLYMKKTTAYLIIIVTGLCLAAAPLFLCVCGFLLPPVYEETFLGELKEKIRLLEETPGRRIVLVGGSGVAFDYDSSLLETAFPQYKTVNFGMYGGLGTKVMLDLSEGRIREGDIVIFSPEQQEQSLSCYFGAEYLWQAADGDFGVLKGLGRENWGQLAGEFPWFAMEKLNYAVKGKKPKPDGVYRKASFDEKGDIRPEACSANSMEGGYDPNTPVQFSPELLEEAFLKELNAYARKLTKRGAAVWYRFCPVNARAVENKEELEGYYEYLQEKLCFPVMGNPENSVMDAEWFYDTNFHLNASGKTVNTIQTVRDMKAMLGDSSKTEFALPQKPKMEEGYFVEGDDRDASCFTWEEQEGAVVLTGLTKEGQQKQEQELTVPASVGGFSVRELSRQVFAGNRKIKTVTLQENIRLIEDGAFAGCSGLKEVILTQKNPEDCLVGEELLKDCGAVILVPEEALSDYRLSYSWSRYGQRIKGVPVTLK